MDMHGERRIPAPRAIVWEKLNDPETLKGCIPGCESIDRLSDTEFTAKVVARVGPVRASFAGKITLSDIDPPAGYTISGEGQGGVAGFARGGAKVMLADEGSETVLSYDVQAQVGGKLAQIGSRLVDAAAKKVADDFFRNFNQKVGAAQGGEDTTVVIKPPLEGEEHDEHGKPIPRDPELPEVSNTKLMLFAGGALIVFFVALYALVH